MEIEISIYNRSVIRIIHRIVEGDLKIILGVTIGETIIENKDTEIEVEVETVAGIILEIVPGMTIHEVEILVEMEVGGDKSAFNLEWKTEGMEIGQYQDQNHDQGNMFNLT